MKTKKLLLLIYILFSVFYFSINVNSQTNPHIYLHDGVLMKGCEQFYPIVCNYIADIREDGAGGIYAAPDFHYQYSYCNNYTDCDQKIEEDFNLISQMGFNTVRIGGISVIGANNCITGLSIRIEDNYNVPLSLYNNEYLTMLENVINIAEDNNLKVILITGADSIESPAYRGFYTDYLSILANHFKNDTTILAYDLFNEPYYSSSFLFNKTEVFQIENDWYNAIRSITPNQLVTIGLCHDNDVFRWDPAIMAVDFLSFHVYPWIYNDTVPSQLHYDPDFKFVKSKLRWFSLAIDKPWMIGETAFSGVPQFVMDTTSNWDISMHPYVHGTEYDQTDYAYFSLHRIKACGAMGYSWWLHKDLYWYPRGNSEEHQNYYGLIDTRAVGNADKDAISVFQAYNYQQCNDNCNLNSLDYVNPLNYPNHRIHGRVVNSNNVGIENAVVYAKDNSYHSYSTFTTTGGYFNFYWDNRVINHILISFPGMTNEVIYSPCSLALCTLNNPIVLYDLPSNQMPQTDFADFRIPAGTSVTWNDNVSINNNLILNANCTLTVNSDVFFNETSQLILEPGALLILENGSHLTAMCPDDKWEGLLHVKGNATLLAKGGSTIEMGGSGTIFIDSTNNQTGELIFMNNANIILSDYETKLDIKGRLRLLSGAHFYTQGKGYVRFSSTLSDSQCYNITGASNSSMSFVGETQNHKKLEITQASVYLHGVNNISFADCKVVMSGSNSRLSLSYGSGGSILIDNILITSSTGNRTGHRGIALYGQSNITIENSVFSNGMYGIHAMLNFTDGAPLTLTNCAFYNNDRGLNVNDKGITLNDCTFDGNGYGVYADGMTFSSTANNSSITYSTNDGINYISASTGGLNVLYPLIMYNSNNGIAFSGATKLTVRCGDVRSNLKGITFSNNASLNMSENETPIGGRVRMSVNTENNIYASNGNLLFLNSGYNNLQRNTNKKVITGNLGGYSACPTYLSAQNNRWNSSNSSPVYNTDYTLIHNGICRRNEIYLSDNAPTYGVCSALLSLSMGDNSFAGSSVINTQNYNGITLSNALFDAVSLIENAQYYTASDRLFEILNYPLLSTSAADDYYLNKAYLYMKQNMAYILQDLVSDTTITAQNTLANHVGHLKHIQNNIIAQTQNDTNAYNRYYYASLDKALLYRAIYDYDNALSHLNSITTWVKPQNTDELNKWICLTQLEKDVLDSIVRKEDFFELKHLCENNMQLKIASNDSNDTLHNEEPVTDNVAISVDEPYITVTPNPVTNQSLINVYVPDLKDDVVIRIFDVLGTLHSEIKINEIQSTIRISNTAFKDGIYQFVLLQGNTVLDNVRVIFVKD
ncbi:MAG: cellulase family glycosylhydrolase [Bacteroidales bacterium]|nr:cellulase family glycosylhydrolase [Bacteroidales bacterium]